MGLISAIASMLTTLYVPSFRAKIPNMSALELLFALLLVCVLASIGGVAWLVWSLVRRADGQARDVADLRGRLERGDVTQDAQAAELRERLSQTQSVMEGLRSAMAARQPVEEDARASLRHIESVIPDAAYDVCRSSIVDAHKRHVMVVGYGMALPYLLTLYQLHLQFARTVDMERMQSALIDVERHLDVLEGILENKLQRAVTMLQNAYGEGKQVSARIRASAESIQVAEPATGGVPEISTDSFSLALVDQVH